MERNEMINILNDMCERCLIKGMISTIENAKILCEVFERFQNNNYENDEEYSHDILYLYELAVKLHESGNTSLGESYSIYSALLYADNINFVEINNSNIDDNIKIEPVEIKEKNKSKENDGVVDVSDIIIS